MFRRSQPLLNVYRVPWTLGLPLKPSTISEARIFYWRDISRSQRGEQKARDLRNPLMRKKC